MKRAFIAAIVLVAGVFGLGAAAAFTDQALGDGDQVVVNTTQFDDGNVTADANHTVVVTYDNGSATIVAGTYDVTSDDGDTVTVEIGDAGGFSGDHTAHAFNDSDVSDLSAGDTVSNPGAALGTQTATVVDTTLEFEGDGLTGDIDTITVEEANVDGVSEFYLVVHESNNGTAGDIVAQNNFTESQTDVNLSVNGTVDASQEYIAMLHFADGGSLGDPVTAYDSDDGSAVPVTDSATLSATPGEDDVLFTVPFLGFGVGLFELGVVLFLVVVVVGGAYYYTTRPNGQKFLE